MFLSHRIIIRNTSNNYISTPNNCFMSVEAVQTKSSEPAVQLAALV